MSFDKNSGVGEHWIDFLPEDLSLPILTRNDGYRAGDEGSAYVEAPAWLLENIAASQSVLLSPQNGEYSGQYSR